MLPEEAQEVGRRAAHQRFVTYLALAVLGEITKEPTVWETTAPGLFQQLRFLRVILGFREHLLVVELLQLKQLIGGAQGRRPARPAASG